MFVILSDLLDEDGVQSLLDVLEVGLGASCVVHGVRTARLQTFEVYETSKRIV